jgi:hypothetical protein
VATDITIQIIAATKVSEQCDEDCMDANLLS